MEMNFIKMLESCVTFFLCVCVYTFFYTYKKHIVGGLQLCSFLMFKLSQVQMLLDVSSK